MKTNRKYPLLTYVHTKPKIINKTVNVNGFETQKSTE